MSLARQSFETTVDSKTVRIARIGISKLEVNGIRFQPHQDENTDFLIVVNNDFIITSGISDKIIKFWKISDILANKEEQKTFFEWKHAKKLTAMHWIDFNLNNTQISGILYSDRFGEVRFFNTKNLPQPGKEETKEEIVDNEERENNANLLFAHQDIISHLELIHDNKYILTVDSCKIKTTHFPEVVCVHSVVFHGMKDITNFHTIGDSHFLAFSNLDRCIRIWKISEDSTDLVREYTEDDFKQLINEEYTKTDKITINKVDSEGNATGTLKQTSSTKVLLFKVSF